MSTILITGCSSGFGLETARHFLAQGWQVIATMRQPDAAILPPQDGLRVLPLDVTDPASIAAALAEAGPIDALVNNAGVGLLNAFEGTPEERARAVFDTNLFGAMAMVKAVLPGMRARGTGVIVNVSSSVTLRPLPALAVYSASKAALNAFTESLDLEIAQFGLRARIVLPGAAPSTAFGANAMARWGLEIPAPYAEFVQGYMADLRNQPEVTEAGDVASAVWRAVTDPGAPMRLPAGRDAEIWFAEAGYTAA